MAPSQRPPGAHAQGEELKGADLIAMYRHDPMDQKASVEFNDFGQVAVHRQPLDLSTREVGNPLQIVAQLLNALGADLIDGARTAAILRHQARTSQCLQPLSQDRSRSGQLGRKLSGRSGPRGQLFQNLAAARIGQGIKRAGEAGSHGPNYGAQAVRRGLAPPCRANCHKADSSKSGHQPPHPVLPMCHGAAPARVPPGAGQAEKA